MQSRMRWAFAVGAVLAMVFSTATGTVRADHPPPTAVAEASFGGVSSLDSLTDSLTVRPGDSVTFSAARSTPGSGGSFDLTRWFFGYGTAQDFLDGASVTYAFAMDGIYEVSLIVRDVPSGKMDLDTVRIVVTSPDYGTEVPGAAILASPGGPVTEDTLLTFDGRSSWPASYTGTKVYEWDFGDGGTSPAGVAPHAYGYAGTYTVRLTVRDEQGHADTATTTVTVQNAAPQAAFAFSPANPGMDSPVFFDATATTDTATDLPVLAYEWDFGDPQAPGQPGWGRTPSQTYNAPGTYTVTLTVRDDNGLSSTATTQVTVANVLPVADAGSAVVVKEAETARLDGTGSSDTPSDAASLTYSWMDGAVLSGARPTHVWYDETSTKLDLVVTDPHPGGTSAVHSVPVTVQNRAPYASIVGASKSGSIVTIRGIAHEVGEDSLTLTWAFGDGSPSAVQAFPNAAGTSPFRVWWNVTHNFPSGQGTYAVTLTADDGDGGTDVASAQVTSGGGIDNPAPTVTAISADSPTKAEDTAFTFTPSLQDGGEAVPPPPATPFLWDFGDGTTPAAGIGPVTHAYARAGTYTVILKVTDSGGDSGANSRQVTVTNVVPTAAFTAPSLSVTEDDYVDFDAASSSDTPSDDPALMYAWDLGDGSRASGPALSHQYRHEGTYTVTLTVTDDKGETGTASQTLTVVNADPSPAITVLVQGAERHATVLSALTSEDSDADTVGLTYSWGLGDVGTATGARVAHGYAAQGTYAVTVTATDAHGAVGFVSLSLTVADTPPRVFAGPDQWFYGPAGPTPVPLHFHGAAEDDDGEALTYTWAFGDGATTTGQDAEHAYTVAGVYTVTLTVTDASGAQAQDTLLVTVNLDSDGDQRSDACEDGAPPCDPLMDKS